MSKIKFIVFSSIILCTVSFSQQKFEIELVESIPIETTLDNPDIRNTQEVWLEMINSAQKTLDIEQFYITNEEGEPLDTVLKAIISAAKRGVNVRIIVDSEMYNTYPSDVDWLYFQSLNIVCRVIDIKSLKGGIQHAKFFIVDDKQVFLGSQNFDWRSLKHIHELGVKINDTACINVYRDVFNYDWCASGFYNDSCIYKFHFNGSRKNSGTYGSMIIRQTLTTFDLFKKVDYSGYFTDLLPRYPLLLDLKKIKDIIKYAKFEINLQFLTYNVNYRGEYWSEVDSALINGAARGVKVKLIVSDWNLSKQAVEHFKELITHPNIEIKYTSIPEWSGGYIPFARVEHCKFITADSVCWIGTSNMSKDYFYNSRNVGVVIENGKFTQRVRDIFYKSWNSEYAHRIEPNGVYEAREHGERN